GRAGADLFVLATRRGHRAPAVDGADHLLDRDGRRHPAQGTADPDVRRADDRYAGDPGPNRDVALASTSGLGPGVDAAAGAAMVRRDLLARRRRLLFGFDRR